VNADSEEKAQRLRRFAFSFLVACENRRLNEEDIAHVLGYVAEVTSAASLAEASNVPPKEQFIQKIAKHLEFYRGIRNNPHRVEESAKAVAALAQSPFKH